MLLLVKSKADEQTLKKAAEDLDGYIKFVVDINQEFLTAGGTRHSEGEQLLMQNGSRQENLWGGGLDMMTGEIDYDSMINIRPNQDNPDRTVLFPEIRNKIQIIVRKLLK